VRRELRLAQTRARTHDGRPTFPVLHERDEDGKRVKVPRNAVPCFHGFRHQAASQYIADGWTVEEVADLLGDTVKTVSEVYRHQIDNASAVASGPSGWQRRLAASWQRQPLRKPPPGLRND
jgi:integrase